ncbi:Rust resistance kinase Lr10 [Vitis vinifera]|uniref:Rust resistance kinase Lr10 n=1 Tax=Vitis vinifera TaxID=29760 RepID=A0A438JV14_VITVI|nr:Rust resistance kinase Lr10 [Vitis vinifera]
MWAQINGGANQVRRTGESLPFVKLAGSRVEKDGVSGQEDLKMLNYIPRNSSPIPTMEITSLPFLIFFISTFLTLIHSQSDTSYYNLCKPFDCGNITFSFPFSLVKQLYLSPHHEQQSSNFITVVDHPLINDLSSGSCVSLGNLSIPTNAVAPLKLPSWGVDLTFFQCSTRLPLPQDFLDTLVNNFTYNCQEGYALHLLREVRGNESRLDSPPLSPVLIPSGCGLVSLPVSRASLTRYGLLNSSDGENRMVLKAHMELEQLLHVLRDGFPLQWSSFGVCESCKNKGGRCGYDSILGKVDCFCEAGHCQQLRHQQSQRKLIVGLAAGGSFIVVAAVVLSIFEFKKRIKKSYSRKTQTVGGGRNAEQFIKEYQSAVLTNYSYNDMKKMSSGFKDKLGQGGFGNVYLGKMLDGRLIAIKMLEKSNHEISHDFVNEVASIVHAQWITGGLDVQRGARLSLGLARLLEIAIGVAHGIEYLHNGCESRILHLDIKPQNILLDHNLNPKISDFGLAKVYSRDRSAVSVTCARGTIGYIAPEIFMRNVGSPSHKSDVYSYGMLLLDMVGGKKHVVSKMMASSESYFPDWIHDKVMEEEGMEEPIFSVAEEEVGIAKKMIMVGSWCIQMDPRDRPSMARVVEMLNGSAEAIQMPPKPFFSSSSPAHFEQEITYSESDTGASLPLFESSQSQG